MIEPRSMPAPRGSPSPPARGSSWCRMPRCDPVHGGVVEVVVDADDDVQTPRPHGSRDDDDPLTLQVRLQRGGLERPRAHSAPHSRRHAPPRARRQIRMRGVRDGDVADHESLAVGHGVAVPTPVDRVELDRCADVAASPAGSFTSNDVERGVVDHRSRARRPIRPSPLIATRVLTSPNSIDSR